MNSSLYDRKAVVPDTLLKHLQKCFDSTSTSENDEGGKRNKELRDSKVASYQQIKRIKNWFDQYSGNKEDSPFILNGGDRMKNWCDEVLKTWRGGINNDIKNKKGQIAVCRFFVTRDQQPILLELYIRAVAEGPQYQAKEMIHTIPSVIV